MKRYLLLLAATLLSVSSMAQVLNDSVRYNLYVNNLGYNAVSTTPQPQVAIWGKFENLLAKPTTLTGYGVTNTITINGSTQNLSSNPSYTISTSIPAATVLPKSSNYTVTLSDFGTAKVLYVPVDATSGSVTITAPTASTITGYTIIVSKTDASANSVIISGLSTDNIMTVQLSSKEIISNGTSLAQN